MHLKSLTLRQFRSYRDLTVTAESGVNLFLGANGAGKTNLLEAVAVLATGASPRGADSDTLIQWGETGFYLKGTFGFEDGDLDPLTLEMKLQTGAPRVIRQNGQEAVRLRDLIGRVPIVSFVPEDMALIKGEPDVRRRAMNMILMQVDPSYAGAAKTYAEALRSRNAALRQMSEGRLTEDALKPWDAALIRSGLVLCRKRAGFVDDFSARANGVHRRVSNGQESLRLEYRPSVAGPWGDEADSAWRRRVEAMRVQETAVGMTLLGPHRDDVAFLLNGRPARSFASEGQTRTAALSFKLAEIPYLNEKTGQKPLCLLDDVLSELDAQRAAHLLDELSRTGQCFVTLTGLENWPKDHALPAAIFRVDQNGVHPESPVAIPA